MKKISLFSLIISFVAWESASAVSISVTNTADNSIHSAWIMEDGVKVDEVLINDGIWATPNTFSLDFDDSKHVEIYIMTENADPRPYVPSNRNPGGFLAEISSADSRFDGILTDSSWEVSTDMTNWTSATEWGANGDTSTIWYQEHNYAPIASISLDAQWVWVSSNFSSGQPWVDDLVYFKFELTPIPEPSTVCLLGASLCGLVARKRSQLRLKANP